MKIATYNINSINARIDSFINWLKICSPDVVLLQEIKSQFDNFPFFELQSIGYYAKIVGQKSYNGVAIISKHKINLTLEALPNLEDDNARYIEAQINVDNINYLVASIYLPNGNPPYNAPNDNSKFEYKLKWMDAFYKHAKNLLTLDMPVILGGDFNTILTNDDVYNPEAFKNDALFKPEVKQRIKALKYLGYYDAFRCLHPLENGYSFWEYAGNAFKANLGMRIDYLFLSPLAVDKLQSCYVDKSLRAADKPSDHTTIIAELKKWAQNQNQKNLLI